MITFIIFSKILSKKQLENRCKNRGVDFEYILDSFFSSEKRVSGICRSENAKKNTTKNNSKRRPKF